MKPPIPHAKELLVVDDEPMLCRTLSALFTERGFHVTTAGTGHEALEKLHQVRADVVLLDLRLPDSSGLQILSQIKARFPDLRVIMISAYGDAPTIQEAKIRGASDYLAKPFEFDHCFYAAMGLEAVDLSAAQPQADALARMPAGLAQQHHALPLAWDGRTLRVAMADPLDAARLGELKAQLGCEIQPLAVVGGNLAAAIRQGYAAAPSSQPPAHTLPAVEDREEATRLVQDLVRHAKAERATDVHLGSDPHGPWIRERIDGILYDIPPSPVFTTHYQDVVSHLKALARLELGQHRLPQHGRAIVELSEGMQELRLSVVPTPHGEHVAIRLLEPSRLLSAERLGLTQEQRLTIVSLLAKPAGLFLVTGPSGSGKTTSLYAFLSKLNTGSLNLVTIEDPVEHALAGGTQIPVQPAAGLTVAEALRAGLHHDPDVIMVDELQEREATHLAVRTALTGRLVLAGLHTADASSVITRLLDHGVEPFFLCTTVTGILAQRLVRKLCTACREPYEVEGASLVHLGISFPNDPGAVKVFRATGCERCRRTGYRGRTGIFELLVVDHQIRSLIIKRTSGYQIRQSAVSRGMLTLPQAMWLKIQAGETSLEELMRILPPDLH
ncbi:MAG: Flp pilus assembly complex ATPase component TadA [Candidatus Omnitrophica bacterium]|nr:Flp pilus assembly complex ATPase component TadA [Candidatus Omnitrophota bacterium]